MTSLFYLALTDGTTTIELTDGANYSISDESGWLLNVAFDTEQRTVVDSIPINILGTYATGGRSQAGRVRVNYIALLTMLRQIERGQNGDGGVVTLVYTSPNSAPARRIACQVTRWDASTFPTDISSVINLPQNEINEVVLTLEHRVPWVWQSYVYTNLYPDTAWDINPSPVSPGGISTVSQILATGYYGGLGKLRITNGVTGDNFIYAGNPLIAVTSGTPIIVTYGAGWLTGISAIALVLIDSGGTTVRSNYDSTSVTGAMAVASGYRITATLTPTITGNVRLMWKVTGTILREAEFAEVFAHATAEEVWHRDAAAEGVATITAAAHPIDATIAITETAAMADTTLTLSGFPSGATYPTALGPIFAMAGAPAAAVIVYPHGTVPSGIWAGVADAARLAKGGFVARATPAVANTYYAEPGGAAVTMLTAMGVGTVQTLTRRLQLVVIGVNNSATATFSLYIRAFSAQGSYVEGRALDVPPNGADPIHIIMPEMYHDLGFYDYTIYLASSVAGQTFDINRVLAYGVNEETSASLSSTNYSITQTGVITYDPQTLTRPQPAILAASAGATTTRLRTLDLALIRTRTTSVQIIVDAISDGLWQIAAAGAVTPLQALLTRPPAYDAPL